MYWVKCYLNVLNRDRAPVAATDLPFIEIDFNQSFGDFWISANSSRQRRRPDVTKLDRSPRTAYLFLRHKTSQLIGVLQQSKELSSGVIVFVILTFEVGLFEFHKIGQIVQKKSSFVQKLGSRKSKKSSSPLVSVTRCRRKKGPNFLQKVAKKFPHQFNIKSAIFHTSLKCC